MESIRYQARFADKDILSMHRLIFDRTCYLSYVPGKEAAGLQYLKDTYTPENIKTWSHDMIITAYEYNTLIGFGRAKKDGWITHLYVDRRWQQHGIGTQILDWLELRLSALHHRHIRLNADPKKQKFYEKRGYVSIGESLDHHGLLLLQMEKKR